MFMKAGNTCVVKNVHINRCSHIFDENSKNKRIKIFKALKMTHCEIEKLGVSTELLSVSLYAANEVYLEKVSKTNKGMYMSFYMRSYRLLIWHFNRLLSNYRKQISVH